MPPVPSYRAHGLTIAAETALPYATGPGRPDLTIERGTVEPAPGEAASAGALCRVLDDTTWIDVPGVSRYRVDPDRIVLAPAHHADEDGATAFLTNTAIGFALVARDQLVLEAAAVERDGRAVLVLAHAGGGRSTLAAQLTARGHGFLSDDLVVVTDAGGTACAHPGGIVQRLWPDVLVHLGLDPAELEPVRPGIAKRLVPAEPAGAQPVPVAGLIVLGTTQQPEPEATPVEAAAKFAVAHRHTFRHRALRPLGLRRDHFDRLTRLASQVPMARIDRPAHGDHLDTVADLAEKTVTEWIG